MILILLNSFVAVCDTVGGIFEFINLSFVLLFIVFIIIVKSRALKTKSLRKFGRSLGRFGKSLGKFGRSLERFGGFVGKWARTYRLRREIVKVREFLIIAIIIA